MITFYLIGVLVFNFIAWMLRDEVAYAFETDNKTDSWYVVLLVLSPLSWFSAVMFIIVTL
jgi:hypothetical protein